MATHSELALGYGNEALAIGQRIELHPATDRWMRGDRYGKIVKLRLGTKTKPPAYFVTLDKSGKTIVFAPSNVRPV